MMRRTPLAAASVTMVDPQGDLLMSLAPRRPRLILEDGLEALLGALRHGAVLRIVGTASIVLAYGLLAARLGLSQHGALPLFAVFTAAWASSIAGFAFSAICGAFLFHILGNPVEVVEIMLLCSIVNQAFSVYLMWRQIVWGRLAPFLMAGLAGVPLGCFLLLHSDPRDYIKGFGLTLTAYALYMLLRRPAKRAHDLPVGDWVAGFIGGVIGGFAAIPGAAVSIWVARRGWDKVEQRAVFQPYILAMQIVALAFIHVLGHGGHGLVATPSTFVYLPLSLLGTWFGMAVFKRLTDRQFAHIVNALLIVSGVALLA